MCRLSRITTTFSSSLRKAFVTLFTTRRALRRNFPARQIVFEPVSRVFRSRALLLPTSILRLEFFHETNRVAANLISTETRLVRRYRLRSLLRLIVRLYASIEKVVQDGADSRSELQTFVELRNEHRRRRLFVRPVPDFILAYSGLSTIR